MLTPLGVPALAQQTLIIGGGAPVIGGGAGGVVINDEVLESLGPATPTPALTYPSPGAAPTAPGAGGVVYRQPDTGQLLVTRPGTLLFPPPRYPKSRLTAQAPARGAAQAPPTGADEPELSSRLLVPPAPKAAPRAPSQVAATPAPAPKMAPVPVEPVAEKPVAAAEPPPPVMQPAPKPEAAEPAPAPQISAQPAPSAPATGAAEPPPPSALMQELSKQPAPAAQEAKTEPAAPSPAPAASPEPPAAAQLPATAPPAPAGAETPSAVGAEPPPPPAKALTAEPAIEAQTAALPPPGAQAEQVRVLFQEGSAELGDDAKGRLTRLAETLKANASVRVQLLAYAKGTAESASRARRLSLSRALTVRAFLIEQGVRSTRMDVRALGDKAKDGPLDRVDILPQPASQ